MKIHGYIKENLKKRLIEDLEKEKGKIVVFSALSLSDEEKELLYAKIPRLKGAYIEFITDRNLIAGVIIKIGSKVIDLSLKGQLNNLAQLAYETNR